MKEFHRVHADIHLDRICNNLKRTKEIISEGAKLCAIVKADAYGHGAVPVSKIIDPYADMYAVATIEEAKELREAKIVKPILILGFTPEPCVRDLVFYDVMPAIFNYEMAEWVSKEAQRQNKTAKVHIKLDTGMSRIGFALTEENISVIGKIAALDCLEIVGCFTHFARADEKNLDFTMRQMEAYDSYVAQLEAAGVNIPVKHISNSAGIMMVPAANKDMVRSGISTYGLYPSDEVDQSRLLLEPAMEIKSYVSYVKELDAGVGISYGGTYVTDRTTKVATIPVGYGDGYPRALSSKGHVLIHGHRAPILGRVCMDQFMVDVTDIPDVAMGDKVTLVGRDGAEQITVEELAAQAYSFNYEFVCDVGKRIPRVYYYEQKKIGTLEVKNEIEWTIDQK